MRSLALGLLLFFGVESDLLVGQQAVAETRFRSVLGPSVQLVTLGRAARVGAAPMRRRSAGKAALVGGVIGGAAGALFGAVAPKSCCVPLGWSRGEAVALWGGGGAVAGVLVGWLVGSRGSAQLAPGVLPPGHPTVTNGGAGIRLGWRIPLGR